MEWIDVNKEKPMNGQACFVTGIYTDEPELEESRFYGTDVYMNDIWCDTNKYAIMAITHWMPYQPPAID